MTPYEQVLQHYRPPATAAGGVPFVPLPLQLDSINALARHTNQGHWHDMGTGKTFMSTFVALYHKITSGNQTLVIMPPNLITQWGRWLKTIRPAPSVTHYRGTPAERAELPLDSDFILVGVQILKRDRERLLSYFSDRALTVIVDEANFVANIESENHQVVYDICMGRIQILMTGTPANKPGDVYGLLKFTSPGTYRSKKHFENLHVDERDFYDKPIKWKELDYLSEVLMHNSKRILFSDLYSDAEEPLYDPITYPLDPDHRKLYRKLCADEMLKLPEGGKIDATTANRLRHALGQIVVNKAHFSGDPKARGAALEMIEEKLHEMGDGKLVVFAHYKMTVRFLVQALAKYGAVGINGEVSEKGKDRNKDRFIEDPKCRVIVIQYISGGKGLDGLQHVCHTAMCIEPCQQPRDFHQAVARLKRMGQRMRVLVMLAIADGTLQKKAFDQLIANDTLVNQVVRNVSDLQRELYGET